MKEIVFSPINFLAEKTMDPPEPSFKKIPDWYKKIKPRILEHNIPRHHSNGYNMTVKMCVPFLDSLTSGYMITLPCDVYCTMKEEYVYRFMWDVDWEPITPHGLDEISGIALPEGYENVVSKFNTFWKIETPPGYSCLITHPLNRFDLPFFTFSAIVDTDKHLVPINLPFVLKRNFEGMIPMGTPIAQVIPFKRDNWKSEIEEYKEENTFWINNLKKVMERSYKKRFWSPKEYK